MAGTYAIAGTQGSGPMAKAMSVAGMVIGGLVALLFALDLALKTPFGGKAGLVPDLGLALCGGILAYLGWNAFREVKYGVEVCSLRSAELDGRSREQTIPLAERRGLHYATLRRMDRCGETAGTSESRAAVARNVSTRISPRSRSPAIRRTSHLIDS